MLPLRRLLRPARAASSVFRRAPYSHYSEPPNVRHVRFRRPWIRSFVTKALLYGTAFHLWTTFVLVRFDDDPDDADLAQEPSPSQAAARRNLHGGNESGGGDVEEVEAESPLFIPLGWSWLQEGERYTAADPEWQQFELATIVQDSVSGRISQILGGPISITGFWLVHQFPSRAPPYYMRSGIEYSDDGLSWVSKPLDPEVGDRLQSYMKPVHVALAIKDAYMLVLKRQWARFTDPEGQALDVVEGLSEGRLSPNGENLDAVQQRESPGLPMPDGLQENPAPSSISHPSSILSSLQRLPLPNLGPGSDLYLASMAFKLRLSDYRSRTPRTPRRGTFFISGPVGLKGPNGFCRFEVRGEYDPATGQWRTVDLLLKDLNFRRQRALG
ncbi:hypothetical protein N7474_002666 [Penicillium riverlandense]|uniref:uncharacterized protein n=1 Tax=Penicillium riverlandense TaxID=1903569 RepID=UPI002549243E|nr:uncharacterized protein N7474_002666 [Penicillium riverlandense]KAJ5825528.1 hypothetical protein N7474_002666 [Penicillium riverlandense]